MKEDDKESINLFSISYLSIHNINSYNPMKMKLPSRAGQKFYLKKNLLKNQPRRAGNQKFPPMCVSSKFPFVLLTTEYKNIF